LLWIWVWLSNCFSFPIGCSEFEFGCVKSFFFSDTCSKYESYCIKLFSALIAVF
jgi:hypothetical protein